MESAMDARNRTAGQAFRALINNPAVRERLAATPHHWAPPEWRRTMLDYAEWMALNSDAAGWRRAVKLLREVCGVGG